MNEYSYTRKIGRTIFSVVVKESESARESVADKLKRLLLSALFD